MSEYINNGQARKDTLKKLILDLHDGLPLPEAQSRFAKLIGDISAVELAHLEQELIEDGLPSDEVKALCDVHVAVFRQSLDGETTPEMTPGHPVHTFKSENFALGELLKLMEETLGNWPAPTAVTRMKRFTEQLAQVDKLYTRKENLLFPILERHGVTGPSSVMWATQDEIRAQVKAFRQALDDDPAQAQLAPIAEAIRSMFYKEEHILLPTALRLLSESEWVEIRDQSPEIGYALVRPGDQWQPSAAAITEAAEKASTHAEAPTPYLAQGILPLDTGGLTAQQINLLLTHLPLDMTFVDENDTVRYYSQSKGERIFVRTPAIIGRKVQNCHPPASVHVVEQILNDFKAGKRDVASFWIQMGGKFVHIRYFALRDAQGAYQGTIEVTQDLAPLRALEGERRLLAETE